MCPVLIVLVLLGLAEGQAATQPQTREAPILNKEDLAARNRQPWYWHRLARHDPGRSGQEAFVVDEAAVAAYPWKAERWKLPTTQAAREQTPPTERLVLEFDGQCFQLRSEGTQMVAWADLYLLGRWWVNGQAVAARRPLEAPHYPEQHRRVLVVDRFTIPFGLPDSITDLKAGDELALQVLYCPWGIRPLPVEDDHGARWRGMEAPHGKASLVPLLSNRVSLRVTEEVLKARYQPRSPWQTTRPTSRATDSGAE